MECLIHITKFSIQPFFALFQSQDHRKSGWIKSISFSLETLLCYGHILDQLKILGIFQSLFATFLLAWVH